MSLSIRYKQYTPVTQENFTNKKNKKENTSFGNVVTRALIESDKRPMIGVAIVDLLTCIGPRTLIDATRNGFAAMETFLRESSGLLINCFAPSFVVFGVAKLVSRGIMGKEFNKLHPDKIWANADSISVISEEWIKTKGTNEARIKATVKNIFENLEGLVGENSLTKNNWLKFAEKIKNPEAFYSKFAEAVTGKGQIKLADLVNNVAEEFGASKNIRLAGVGEQQISCNFKELTRDINDLCHAFIKIGDNKKVEIFAQKLPKLVNTKSLLGLVVITSIASVVQWANRQLTKKRSGCDGFVGDPNYGKNGQKKKMSQEEKNTLKLHKLIGATAMTALAIASFTKKPTLKMLQFKGWFPTMDQCRLISAATFVGRIFASEDKNELRETTIRDMIGFAHLYMLGEFVAKGYAQSKNKQLLYETENLKQGANILQKAFHWMNKVQLKGFEELPKTLHSQRANAQAVGLLYSCLALGAAVPLYNIWKTKKIAANAAPAIDNNKPAQQTKNLFIPPKTGSINGESQKIYAAFLK